jgi:hypothetical protein
VSEPIVTVASTIDIVVATMWREILAAEATDPSQPPGPRTAT